MFPMECLTRRFQFVRRGPLAAMLLAAAACAACGLAVGAFLAPGSLSLMTVFLVALRAINQSRRFDQSVEMTVICRP